MQEPSVASQPREERRPARDGVEEVAPGVLRIQLPILLPGLGHVNCYALEDERGVALVDPGLPGPNTWRQLKRRLTSAGLPIERVHTVVVTHSHPDHFGQAERLRKRNGAEVITHSSFRTFLDPSSENDDSDAETVFQPGPAGDGCDHSHGVAHEHSHGVAHDHSQADDGAVDPARASASVGPILDSGPLARSTPWGGKPFQPAIARRLKFLAGRFIAGRFVAAPSPTRRVEDAAVLSLGGREWISVHTPGHTRDHLCLWDPANGIMLSGDHVLPTITPHISGTGVTVDPLADFFTSLDRMQTFDGVTTVLPAHGLGFKDLAGRADDIKAHHHERLETLRKSGDDLGRGTVEEYMRRLFKQRSWGAMAASETYAHLEHLRLLGQAAVTSDGSQLRYEMRD